MWFGTSYEIKEKDIFITEYFFLQTRVDIDNLVRIQKAKSYFPAPAISFDRLHLHCEDKFAAAISPSDESEFIKKIKTIKPTVQVEERKQKQARKS